MFSKITQFLDVVLDRQIKDIERWSRQPDGERFKITLDGGYAIRLENRTGTASIKGTIVTISDTHDNAIDIESNKFDAIGVVYEDGVAEGDLVWVTVAGRGQVLLEDSTSCTRGQLFVCAETDGRALGITNPGVVIPSIDVHFTEIGHCSESVTAGTDKLAWGVFHFN